MSRVYGVGRVIKAQYNKGFQDGITEGVKLMEECLLNAWENGNPIVIEGKGVFFIKSDIENLRDIFEDLENQAQLGSVGYSSNHYYL